jgi:hypothetical protein
MLQEQLIAKHESSANLIKQVDELKRKTKRLKGSLRSSRYNNTGGVQ